jgi:hypothetical protein
MRLGDTSWSPSVAVIVTATLLMGVTACMNSGRSEGRSTTSFGNQTTVTTPDESTSSIPGTTTLSDGDDWAPPQVCESCPVESVAVVPLGSGGVTYRYVGVPETQPVGPNSLVVSDLGSFFVLDTGGLGVVVAEPSGISRLSLTWPGIHGLVDLAIGPTGLRVLDVPLSNEARVAEVGLDGGLERLVDLPSGVQLENGLWGIATGPEGELWVELEGGARVAVIDPDNGSFEVIPGYPYPEGLYAQLFEEPFPETIIYQAADTEVEIVAEEGSSVGARLLGINPDRSFVLEVVESNQDAEGTLHATTRAHWYQANGTHLGVTDLPLNEQFIYVNKPAAIGPDGQIYYMLTRSNDVTILRLPWSTPD